MSKEPRFYALRITPRAAADIDAAHARFVELTDEEIADDWKEGLLEAIAPLAFLPHRHGAARPITRAEAKEIEAAT